MTLLAASATAIAVYLLTSWATGCLPTFSRWRRPGTRAAARQQWLVQAGVEATPRQFVVGSVALGAITFLLVVGLTATPAVALVPAIAVGLLPRMLLARRRARRMRTLQESWPDGIRDLVAGISAGMSLHRAVLGLCENGPAPLREAFARYPTLSRVVGVIPALEAVKEELADPTSDRVIEILILAHERGGTLLAEILRDLAAATTKDVRAREEAQTEALEQRINARAVFVLPWLVLLVLTAQDGYFRDFYRSSAGLIVVLVGALMSLVGIVVVSRLSREPIEQRVLGASADDGEVAR